MPPIPRFRTLVADGTRRLSALVCLGGAYQFAATAFDVRWLVVVVVAAAVLANGRSYWAEVAPAPPPLPWPARHEWLRWLVPGWLLMAVTAACKLAGVSPRLTIWIWLAGAGWLLAAAWRLSPATPYAPDRQTCDPGSPSLPRRGQGGGLTRAAWISGTLVVAAAFALRVWEIGTVPRYVHCDEGTMAMAAMRFYADPDRDWFAALHGGSYSIMHLFYALVGWGTLVFGFNLAGARASDVVLGTLSVALLFDGLRRVSGVRLATVAALLLAANHCHLAFSRIASGYIQTAFVVALGFALFSRVWTAPTIFTAALLGVVMALGVQTYSASVVALPLLAVTMGVLWLVHPARRRALLLPLGVFAISCATAGATFGVALWQQGEEMAVRSRALNIFSEQKMQQLKHEVYHTDSAVQVVAHQAWNALRGFHAGRDTQPQYGSIHPMADRYTAALMVPGAVLALLGLRQFVATNGLVFTIGYLLFGLGMQWAPGYNRATGALPLGMVLPAIALVQCLGTVWNGRARLFRAGRDLCLAAAVGLCVAANLHLYFVDYIWSRLVGDSSSEAGWAARQYADDYTVHLVNWPAPGPEGMRLIIAGLPIALHNDESSVWYVKGATVTGSDLFIIDAEDPAAREAALGRFPDARLEVWRRDPARGPTLLLFFVGGPQSGRTARQ
jgi:4-amino-4-deoxy-L-arabinose transferase-like glycosyltransferase